MKSPRVPKHILPIIVIAQFCCTSLWFAGNGVMDDLVASFSITGNAIGNLTSAVQFGFITGTLCFAIFTIADRFSPARVFFVCALIGAVTNLGVLWEGNTIGSLLVSRFLTGFFLAGIYPVGMKIAADYFDKGLGKSLGYLVGALVLGTALPHLLKDISGDISWKVVIYFISGLSAAGGLLMVFAVGDGPNRKASLGFNFSACFKVFKLPKFRSAAFGYFGHMWELYAFWALVPTILNNYLSLHPDSSYSVSLYSFLIIGIGGVACVLGGYLSQWIGEKRTASLALILSGTCCLLSPVVFQNAPPGLFLVFLLVWGMAVIMDSPMLSTLVAKNTQLEIKGTSLTIVNSIGFAITIISIQLISRLIEWLDANTLYMLLALGPLSGLLGLTRTAFGKDKP